MTKRTENSLSIPAQISPVNAPKFCPLIFCAPSRRFESRMTFDTDSSAVNGGQMTMSTSLILANFSLRLLTNASASAAVLFIFQLPAIINLRSLFIFVHLRVFGPLHCNTPNSSQAAKDWPECARPRAQQH